MNTTQGTFRRQNSMLYCKSIQRINTTSLVLYGISRKNKTRNHILPIHYLWHTTIMMTIEALLNKKKKLWKAWEKRAHERRNCWDRKRGHNQAMFAQCLLYHSLAWLCREQQSPWIYTYTHTTNKQTKYILVLACQLACSFHRLFSLFSLLGLFLRRVRGTSHPLRGPKVQYWLVILIPILILSMPRLGIGFQKFRSRGW